MFSSLVPRESASRNIKSIAGGSSPSPFDEFSVYELEQALLPFYVDGSRRKYVMLSINGMAVGNKSIISLSCLFNLCSF
jgi:hypothetical protein